MYICVIFKITADYNLMLVVARVELKPKVGCNNNLPLNLEGWQNKELVFARNWLQGVPQPQPQLAELLKTKS